MKRRDFLKVFGGACGAVVLSSCGAGSGSKGGGGGTSEGAATRPPVPNGYRFHRILNAGDAMPDGTTAATLQGSAKINDNSQILVQAQDANGVDGIYELSMEYSGGVPKVAGRRKIVRVGDTLGDGTSVTSLKMGSTNKNGYYATLINDANGLSSVYLEKDKGGLQLVAKALDSLPRNAGKFGASFGDIEIDDTNSLILVSHYVPEGSSLPKEGLFYLCGGIISDAGRLLASSGDALPESSSTVGRLGLVDIAKSDGQFVAQIYCGIPLGQQKPGEETMPASALITGNVNEPSKKPTVLGASKSLRSSSALRGDVIYGPRIGSSKKVAQVVHSTNNILVLYLDGQVVASTGGTTPLGNTIISFSGPMVSDSGLLYYLAYSEKAEELCIFDGETSTTILASGDKINKTDSNAIVSIGYGFVRNMLDSEGRVVFVGQFDDNTSSVMLGIPV